MAFFCASEGRTGKRSYIIAGALGADQSIRKSAAHDLAIDSTREIWTSSQSQQEITINGTAEEMLSSLLRAVPKNAEAVPDPEDLFYSSLGLIFTDDIQNQHGDPDTTVTYRSNGYGDIVFEVADPKAEVERTKFAHHLWNSGVLLGVFVAGRENEGLIKPKDDKWGHRRYGDGQDWWLTEEEQSNWTVKGKKVVELGAGGRKTLAM